MIVLSITKFTTTSKQQKLHLYKVIEQHTQLIFIIPYTTHTIR